MPRKKQSSRQNIVNNICRELEKRGILEEDRTCGNVVKGKSYSLQELFVEAAANDIKLSNSGRVLVPVSRGREEEDITPDLVAALYHPSVPSSVPAQPTIPAVAPPQPLAATLATIISPPPPPKMPPAAPTTTAPPPPPPPPSPPPPPAAAAATAPPPPPKMPAPPEAPTPEMPAKTSLFSEIASGVALKKAVKQPVATPAPKTSLLTELASGVALKKVPKATEATIPPPKESGSFLSSLGSALSSIAGAFGTKETATKKNRLYSIETIQGECIEIPGDDCADAPWCKTDEFGDEEDVCLAGDEEDFYPEWWAGKDWNFAAIYQPDKFRAYLAAQDKYIHSAKWYNAFVGKLEDVPLSLKIADDKELAQVAIWKIWQRENKLKVRLEPMIDALYAYNSPSWNYDLVMRDVLSKLENTLDWQACQAEEDCSGQVLYRVLSATLHEDYEEFLKDNPELAEAQSAEVGIDVIAVEAAQITGKLDQVRKELLRTDLSEAERDALEEQRERLNDELQHFNALQQKLGSVQMTQLITQRESIQQEIADLQGKYDLIIVPPKATVGVKAQLESQKRGFKTKIAALQERLDDLNRQLAPPRTIEDEAKKRLRELQAQLAAAQAELAAFPPKGGNLQRKGQLRSKIIPDLEEAINEQQAKLPVK